MSKLWLSRLMGGAVLCLSFSVSAGDEYRFAYYLHVSQTDATYTMQEHGLLLTVDKPIERDLGRRQVRFSLAKVQETTGLIVVDVFELPKQPEGLDVSLLDPTHSLDVAFNLNGRQELRVKKEGVEFELTCSITRDLSTRE